MRKKSPSKKILTGLSQKMFKNVQDTNRLFFYTIQNINQRVSTTFMTEFIKFTSKN